MSRGSNKGEHRKEPKPTADNAEGKGSGLLTLDACLTIFGGLAAYDSKRCQKLVRREVYTSEPATPAFLQWSESAITFDRTNHPECVLQPV